ncbi:hypothetical protein T4E_1787 [Trichinella pseudospiralis]|uniref:Apple domain-containing protein n=1 Tax=Trichinella pseudospiralis TaxID=6337 RepID=A0A0V0YN35_TRIPS|nr:hypothetical protein T4E_1787 [Trichinella pseudospiralis]
MLRHVKTCAIKNFKASPFLATQSVRRQSVIAYTASNLPLQILIHYEPFYASKAAIRLQLWDSSDDTECLKICLTSNRRDYCDAYYFSSIEQTCLTMRLKKQYALPKQHGHQIITKFYDGGCGSEIFTPKTEVVWSLTIPSTPQTLSHNVVHERKEEEEGKRDIVVCYNEAKSGVDSFDNLVTLHICAGDGNIGGRWFCGSTFWIAKG